MFDQYLCIAIGSDCIAFDQYLSIHSLTMSSDLTQPHDLVRQEQEACIARLQPHRKKRPTIVLPDIPGRMPGILARQEQDTSRKVHKNKKQKEARAEKKRILDRRRRAAEKARTAKQRQYLAQFVPIHRSTKAKALRKKPAIQTKASASRPRMVVPDKSDIKIKHKKPANQTKALRKKPAIQTKAPASRPRMVVPDESDIKIESVDKNCRGLLAAWFDAGVPDVNGLFTVEYNADTAEVRFIKLRAQLFPAEG
jgi:hypothetical protein